MAAKSRTMAQQKTKEAYCFIVPAFIYMILVLGYPIVYNIILSLKDVNVKNLKSGTSVFVGLQNYIDLFHDPTFLLVLRNTFIFTIACLIFQFTIGFAFAMFFNQKFKLCGSHAEYSRRSDQRSDSCQLYDANGSNWSSW